MPVTAASRSIDLDDSLAAGHDVQFFVHSKLIGADLDRLNRRLPDHLAHLRALAEQGALGVVGPFFTEHGHNTGDGFYVLKVDDLAAAARLAEQDPLHRHGIRTFTVTPWLQASV